MSTGVVEERCCGYVSTPRCLQAHSHVNVAACKAVLQYLGGMVKQHMFPVQKYVCTFLCMW
jgi:hypothetical protein